MILKFETIRKLLTAFFVCLLLLILMHVIVGMVNMDLAEIFHRHIDSTSFFIEFAPEIWLTLMSVVLGTLIIVISIASQSNPKLIDYYIGDYPSLYYTCAITIAGIENVYMQLNLSINTLFWNNIIFINAYFLLPLAVINAIPYAFYILSYTKTSSLIRTIYLRNKGIIKKLSSGKVVKNAKKIHFGLLDTINQLDDQHGYVKFKEPKSQILEALSKLLRFYISHKHAFHKGVYKLTPTIKSDISFRTLSEKFDQMEANETFFEHKVLRVYSGLYYDLIEQGHHDLASQCANELARVGTVASEKNNRIVLDLITMQFNTFLRFGIKYATQTKDIRNVYNCVFHYAQMILLHVRKKDKAMIVKSCEYLTYYGREIYKLSFRENYMAFLIDTFAYEIQRILMAVHKQGLEEEIQLKILKTYATLEPEIENKGQLDRVRHNTARSIKINLILFYLEHKEYPFVHQLIMDITEDLRYFNPEEILLLIRKDCKFLSTTKDTFWEYTDRGDKNIYYTPYKSNLKEFFRLFLKLYRFGKKHTEKKLHLKDQFLA